MNTIKQIMEDNGKGIHSLFNACMHKAECCSKYAEIAELKLPLEEASKGALVCANRILQQEQKIGSIYQQLIESQAREARLREALRTIADLRNMGRITPEVVAFEALSIPHDDTALKEYRDAVIEKCAEVCESMRGWPTDRVVSDDCAKAVRNLKSAVKSTTKGDLNVI